MTYRGTYDGNGSSLPMSGVRVDVYWGGSTAIDEAALDVHFNTNPEATYFVADWNYLLVPGWANTNLSPQVIIDNHGVSDTFSTFWSAYIYIGEPGTWQFVNSSDDASDFWIDGVKVASHYGGHAAPAPSQGGLGYGTAVLEVGWHFAYARQSEQAGGAAETLYYRSPSMVAAAASFAVVDSTMLVHEAPSYGDYWATTGSGSIGQYDFVAGDHLVAKGSPPESFYWVVEPQSGSSGGLVQGKNTLGPPSFEIINEFEANVVNVASWVDIYLSDNVTPWREKVPITDGTVSVDMTRAERRNLDLTISDSEGDIGYGPGAFWYDKIIKPYRGIELANGNTYVSPLGEFWADSISRPYFPSTIQVSARDASKKLIQDKFAVGTTFAAGANVGTVIQAIAVAGGVSKFAFSTTTSVLPEAAAYEIGDERWAAMTDLATSIGFEIFFNALGFLVFRPFVDPFTAGVTYTFRTGTDGNLVNFTRATSDTFLFNDVVVYDPDSLIYGRATNENPASPTNITEIGRRLRKLESSFLADNAAAESVAQAYLQVSSLEQYDVSLEALIIPWLEAGDAVELQLPNAEPGEPTRYLLTNFTIPLGLGSMSGSAKRVTIVT